MAVVLGMILMIISLGLVMRGVCLFCVVFLRV